MSGRKSARPNGEGLAGRLIAAEFFAVFGVAPRPGRALLPADAVERGASVVLLAGGVARCVRRRPGRHRARRAAGRRALGILCSALVCLAVGLVFSARTTTDRILAVILPISAFVAAGYQHSIANMYFIPIALLIRGGAAPPSGTRSAAAYWWVQSTGSSTCGRVRAARRMHGQAEVLPRTRCPAPRRRPLVPLYS